MTEEVLKRAVEIHAHQRLAEHEAAHVAAAFALGLRVADVTAPYWALEAIAAGDPDSPAGRALIERPNDHDGLRKFAIAVMAGQIENGAVGWPPRWPLTLAPDHGDEADLCELVKTLELDQTGYSQLVADAYKVLTSPQYERSHGVIAELLERHGHLDGRMLAAVKAVIEGERMEHTVKSATVTATERGEFTAIAAAYTVDRMKDQIIPGAFAATIERWRVSGKRVPLHWDHKGEAANVIGWIDPAAMRETAEGLRVSGRLDIDTSDTAREAWRSMKNDTMSLSFGYITLKRQKRSDGINELHELDLFEISIVPHPANPDTRVIEMKSIADDADLKAFRRQCRDQMLACMGGNPAETLKQKSKRIQREFAPIQIASFRC